MNTQNEKLIDLKQQLDVNMSTLNFVGLSILTCSFYANYWFLNLIKKVNELKGSTVVPISHLLIVICAFLWLNTGFFSHFMIGFAEGAGNIAIYDAMAIAALFDFAMYMAIFIFNAIISLKIASFVQELATEYGETKPLSKPLIVILSYFYIYYRLHNLLGEAKDRPDALAEKFASIEKLAQLKANGSITEEEFQKEKEKIFGDSNS